MGYETKLSIVTGLASRFLFVTSHVHASSTVPWRRSRPHPACGALQTLSAVGLACEREGEGARDSVVACSTCLAIPARASPRREGGMLTLLFLIYSNTPRSTLQSALAGSPRLGLGMASLGRPGYINLGHADDLPKERTMEQMREHAFTVLDEALALGLRYIDCARSYGLSEEFVAAWLASRGDAAAAMVTGSKWGYEYTANWRVQVDEGESHEVKKHTPEQLERQLAETRALLPDVALYQIHSATRESGVLANDAVLEALAQLRAQGIAVGASVSNPQLPALEAAIAVECGDAPLFASVQATFNLLDQSAAPLLQAAAEAGVFVIVKEALANGRLTSRAVPSKALELLSAEAAKLDTTTDALALAWVLTFPWVGMCLSGASTCERAHLNFRTRTGCPIAELHCTIACPRFSAGD